jgi:hypothetical protein
VWECRLCRERFIPSGSPEQASCPKCGSNQVGSAAAAPPDDAAPPADPPSP